ncbi:MAG: hypothetical protein EON59_07350 [Alphaproteobacteria bacterium]|nr:MAG: hypothetical protein EON59_07350 [Alphaproteobacteria bacterium]
MSSVEIADVTGKAHKHVLADVRRMLIKLEIQPAEFSARYTDAKGEARECFNLPKRETLILVSGYSVEMRAKIIDRWLELEAGLANPHADLIEFADRSRVDTEVTRDLIRAQGESTRGAIIKSLKDIVGSPVVALKSYLEDRFVALHKRDTRMIHEIEGFARHQELLHAAVADALGVVRQAGIGTFVGNDWVTAGGICALAGVAAPIQRYRALSARMVASLTAYSFEVDRQMDVRCPPYDRRQRLYRASLVKAWLKDRGRALIAAHIAKHCGSTVVPFPAGANGEAR